MLFFLLLHLINYMNIKFQKYKDVFSQPERIRLKRKTNESDENIIVRNATNNSKSKIIANIKNTSQEHAAKNETNSGKNRVNIIQSATRKSANDSGDFCLDNSFMYYLSTFIFMCGACNINFSRIIPKVAMFILPSFTTAIS